jgi:hypothetical protein
MITLRIERLWNALALGGVVFALLVTAGVVNLGDSPYWSYFSMTSTSPDVTAEASRKAGGTAVGKSSPAELQPQPDLGTISEVADNRTANAIGQDPAEDDTLAAAPIEAPAVLPAGSEPSLQASSDSAPVSLHATLTTPDGPNPTLRAHDEIKALLLTTTDAFAYCYYADGSGTISRIFPNRFQPDPLVRSGALQLPDSTGAFTLIADQPGRTEEIRCMAATSDVGSRLPSVLSGEDLVPLPVRSLNEVSSMFRSLSEEVVETRLVAVVAP